MECSKPPAKQARQDVMTLRSWAAATDMVLRSWLAQEVPTAYAQSMLDVTQREVQKAARAARGRPPAPVAGVDVGGAGSVVLAHIVAARTALVRGDRGGAGAIAAQLARDDAALSTMKRRLEASAP